MQHQEQYSLFVQSQIHSILLEMARVNLEGWDRTSEQRTKAQSESVKLQALRYYGIRNECFCQIHGGKSPNVVNAHIWPVNNKTVGY